MPGHFLSVVLAGFALIHGAEPTPTDPPATVDATPVETSPVDPPPAPSTDPAPLPELDLPAHNFQGEPAPPQTIGEPAKNAAPPATEAPPETPADETNAKEAISAEMIRPTEKKDRSGQKVVAFWFITTKG
jgi:hypothetical protein